MRLLLTLLFAAHALLAADAPIIFYSKSFPGSKPAFVAVTLEPGGKGEYKEAPNDENPVVFKLSEAEYKDILALAERLDRFKRPLEANVKVAMMGIKTFRWEAGGEKNEVKFNYSEDPDARLLADWFERISESARYLIDLERTARFDKLGVNAALLSLEAGWDRGRLVAAAQYLPMLDRIAKNESYLRMARERAAKLAELIRASQPKAE